MSPPTWLTTMEDTPREYQEQMDVLKTMMSLGDTEEDECIQMMDYFQSSDEEKEALANLVKHSFTMKHSTEWEYPGVCHLLDEAEMSRDMDAWEDAYACHQLFAMNPWSSRGAIIRKDNEVNKRSESQFWCSITNVGDSYHTAESDYGKVFIPKFLGIQDASVGDMMYICASFQGFEIARKTAMPWRAKYISIIQILN